MKILKMFLIVVFMSALGSCSLFYKEGFIHISNTSFNHEICYVYIPLSTSDTWGEDKLGSSIILSLGSQNFDLEVGTYDVGIDVFLLNGTYDGAFDLYNIEVMEEQQRSLIFDGASFYVNN